MKLHYVKPLAEVTPADEPALAAFIADASQKTGEPWVVLLPGTAIGYLDPERGPVEVANAAAAPPPAVETSALARAHILRVLVAALLGLVAGAAFGVLS